MMGMIATFTACGGSSEPNPILEREPVLDFRSILDTELNLMFSIGDYRGDIEAILGRPVNFEEEWNTFKFENGLTVTYENDRAVALSGDNNLYTGRFEILGYQIGMTEDQISMVFELNELLGEWADGFDEVSEIVRIDFYYKLFNERGNRSDWRNVYVMSGIIRREFLYEPDDSFLALSVARLP